MTLRTILLIAALALQAHAQAARLNVTGTWDGNFMGGSNFQLSQDGDSVVGKFGYGNGDGVARGNWSDGRLILILTPTPAQSPCDPRKILVIPATHLEPYVLDLASGSPYSGGMTRNSPSPGPAVDYPYAAELKNCGQLFTYDLAFDTNSDKLKGASWPILEVLAGLLKKDQALQIQITGHTDSKGDAKANQDLSERRAKTVMQTLVQKYGADPKRLTAKGYGAEQPLAENDSEQGRAINRRVEIVKQ